MTDFRPTPQRVLIVLCHLAAIAFSAKYAYDFGVLISGQILGLVLAANCGVFASIMVGMIIGWVRRPSVAGQRRR
jgi:hypothetical protein